MMFIIDRIIHCWKFRSWKRTLADRKNNSQEEAYAGAADRQEDDKGEVDSSDAYWTVDSDAHSTEDAAGADRKNDTNEGVDQKVDDKVEADANDAGWKENADSTASKADDDLCDPKADVEVEAEGGVRVRDVQCIILSTIIRPIYSFSLLLSRQNFTEVKNWRQVKINSHDAVGNAYYRDIMNHENVCHKIYLMNK
jgi:hypothetical protein